MVVVRLVRLDLRRAVIGPVEDAVPIGVLNQRGASPCFTSSPSERPSPSVAASSGPVFHTSLQAGQHELVAVVLARGRVPREAHGSIRGLVEDACRGQPMERGAAVASLRTVREALHLVVDQDQAPERLDGLRSVRDVDERRWPFRIAYGVAVSKRECWVLLGFEPEDAAERKRLDQLRAELDVDPARAPHRLTAAHPQDKRSAKRVLKVLTAGDRAREDRCVERLRDRLDAMATVESGLTHFVEEVREQLGSL